MPGLQDQPLVHSGNLLFIIAAICSASAAVWLFGRRERFGPAGGAIIAGLALTATWAVSVMAAGASGPVENLAESLQVAFDAGAKRILLPMASVKDIPTIPGELFAKFQTGFYADPVDAVFKALGVQ